MTHAVLTATVLTATILTATGCAGRAPAAPTPSAATSAAATSAAPAVAPAGGPAAQTVALPGVPGPGDPREAKIVLDRPGAKVATIVLRGGTVLPTHEAPVAVTIVALSGTGTVVAGDQRLPLDGGHAVALAPGVPHAVEPTPGTDLVLLVHHLGGGGEHHR